MTDMELRELIASLAIGQKELNESQKKTDKQIQELKESQKRTDEQIQELKESQKKTDEQLRETDVEIKNIAKINAKTDDRLNRIAKMVGNMGNNQGEVAEEYFVNSLKNNLNIGELHFDYLLKNVHLQTKKINDEFDILLINDKNIALIEVKYKVHPKVIDSLAKKIEHLRLMKEYKNYNVYAGVAGFKIPEEVIEKAREKGYFILKRKGNVVEEYIENLIPA